MHADTADEDKADAAVFTISRLLLFEKQINKK